MNGSEKKFYRLLQRNLIAEFIILAKVRVEDFVDVNKQGLSFGEMTGKRNQIKFYHVDFLICDLKTTQPLLGD